MQLQDAPAFSVRVRAQSYESGPEWTPHATGHPEFDARYLALSPAAVDLELLSAQVREAFAAADQPVTLIGKIVRWIEPGHTLDANRIESAVQSCIDVATAIRQRQETSSLQASRPL